MAYLNLGKPVNIKVNEIQYQYYYFNTFSLRVFSERGRRASLFGEFNIDSININMNVIIDVDDQTNGFLHHQRP